MEHAEPLLIMDVSSGQSALDQKQNTTYITNDNAVKEMLKLLALSELMRENFTEIRFDCNVS